MPIAKPAAEALGYTNAARTERRKASRHCHRNAVSIGKIAAGEIEDLDDGRRR